MPNAAPCTPSSDPRAAFARQAAVHNTLVWLHRYSGLAILLFLIFAGVTGSILVFRAPLDAALNPDLFDADTTHVTAAPAARVDAVARAHPDWRITQAPLLIESGRSLALRVAPAQSGKPLGYDEVFIAPQDGHVIGTRQVTPGWGRRGLVDALFQFHFNLLAGTFGRWFMGAVAILWLLSNLVGLYLTFPRNRPFWKNWGRMWRIHRNTRPARFCLELHRAGGLWLFIGFLVLSITSVEMNFYDELFVPFTNAVWRRAPTPFDKAPAARSVAPMLTFSQALDLAEPLAAEDHPGWIAAFATYEPQLGLVGVSFIRPGSDTYSVLGPVAYYLDESSGKPIYRDDPYNDGSRGAFMRSLYPLHAGRILGWPTRIYVLLLGIGTVVLSITGLYVWWRRRR